MKKIKSVFNNLSSRKAASNSLSAYQEGLLDIDEKTRLRLQQTLLSMYLDVKSVCDKYNIVPFLVGGSCLGAIRHKGFIPWDDDLDIGMTRKDYCIFRDVFEKELGNSYYLSAPDYSKTPKARFPKIMKKGTICRELGDNSEPEKCGIALDIFILDNIPSNKMIRIGKGLFCNILEFVGGQVNLKENMGTQLEKSLKAEGFTEYMIRMAVGTICGIVPSYKWYVWTDRAVQFKTETDYIGLPTGRKHYFGEILPAAYFFPPRFIEFCGVMVPVFHEAEKYLINLYGDDYMSLPPIEKRERHLIRELKFEDSTILE